MVKPLYQEDINEIVEDIITLNPVFLLDIEDRDVIENRLYRLLEPFSHGYQNYN